MVEARDRWLNPPELVQRVPEVVPGFPDRLLPRDEKAAATLRDRTLTNLYNQRGTPAGAWLDNLHRALDEAVAAAYGWPADLAEAEVLSRLLALNHARAPIPVAPARGRVAAVGEAEGNGAHRPQRLRQLTFSAEPASTGGLYVDEFSDGVPTLPKKSVF